MTGVYGVHTLDALCSNPWRMQQQVTTGIMAQHLARYSVRDTALRICMPKVSGSSSRYCTVPTVGSLDR